MSTLEVNILVLAYLGDTVYENYVRRYLVKRGINNVNDLQKEAANYVSAKSQAKFLKEMTDNNIFNDEETSVIMRGRNNTNSRHPKNCDIVTYKHATGLEAVIGYLSLENKRERIDVIMNYILGK